MSDLVIHLQQLIEQERLLKVGIPISQRTTITKALEFPLCDSNAGTRISLSDNSFQMNMIFSAPRHGTDDMERDAEYSKGAVWGQAFRDFNLIPYLWKANAILDDNMQSHGFKLVGVNQCHMDTSVFNGHYEQIKNSKEA